MVYHNNATRHMRLIHEEAPFCSGRECGSVTRTEAGMAYGETAGTMADEVDDVVQGKRLTSIVHRADFLQELLADIPRERMHASKKLLRIDGNGPVTLSFTDKTTHECDVLVGADGIHSVVRRLVLGESDPAAAPQNSGAWFLMTLQPFSKAHASLGKELVNMEDAHEYGWAGKSAFLMHNILSNGQPDQWQRAVGVDEIKALYQDWPPHLNRAVNEFLCSQPKHKALYLWDHPNASSYTPDPICITDDTAYLTTLWQGSGAGMSIEDTPSEAVMALQVYDQVRRPRTQRIVESSRITGTMLTGKKEIDPETMGAFMSGWDFIIDIDMGKPRDKAILLMGVQLNGGRAL
ncbi:hypothetical protein F4802DRAFT_605711 [Xylaria palmicola]|nr:hypothetical protein F4802DRAFT_605711 [Xylaria palmicola]